MRLTFLLVTDEAVERHAVERHLPASVADVDHRQALDTIGSLHVLALRGGERWPRLGAGAGTDHRLPLRVLGETVERQPRSCGQHRSDLRNRRGRHLDRLGLRARASGDVHRPDGDPGQHRLRPIRRPRGGSVAPPRSPGQLCPPIKPIRAMPSSFRPVVRPRAPRTGRRQVHRTDHRTRIRHPSHDRFYGPRSGPDCHVMWTSPTEAGHREGHRLGDREEQRPWLKTQAVHSSSEGSTTWPSSAGTWSARWTSTRTCSACRW